MNEPDLRPASPAFRTFEDWEVNRVAREFRKAMDQVAKQLPASGKYGLAVQIPRAAVSLTDNLAEEHGRCHCLNQIRFTPVARGSLEELMDDLNGRQDENDLAAEQGAQLKASALQGLRLLNGNLRYLRDRKSWDAYQLRETPPPAEPQVESEPPLLELEEFLECEGWSFPARDR
jgi:four helix bundle protein